MTKLEELEARIETLENRIKELEGTDVNGVPLKNITSINMGGGFLPQHIEKKPKIEEKNERKE